MTTALKAFFQRDAVQSKVEELVGQNASSFVTSVLQVVNTNKDLINAEPISIFNAACMSAVLKLPINQNLGFAYIIPYRTKGAVLAQFQIGYKCFIQLAQRSGQFQKLVALPVYQSQLISKDPINGYQFDWNGEHTENEQPIGYYAYFRLVNGFVAELYMTRQEVLNHAKKYSQTFKRGFGVWADNFDAMARKTVIKLLLSQQAPLSIEMQQAVQADQAIINSIDGDFRYIDNEAEQQAKANELTKGIDSPEREEIIATAEEIAKTGNSDNLNEYLTEERRKILGVEQYRRLTEMCKSTDETPF
ncbi:MAG: recombinase RecT [Neisseriaceae bacterium]|nr:recombinase RecT [Neisseriaceae bacterium]